MSKKLSMTNLRTSHASCADSNSWQSDDVVVEVVETSGNIVRISRAQASQLPGRILKQWLRIQKHGKVSSIRILKPFKSSEGVMFFADSNIGLSGQVTAELC